MESLPSQEWADQVADGDPNGSLPDPGRGILRLQRTPGGGSEKNAGF